MPVCRTPSLLYVFIVYECPYILCRNVHSFLEVSPQTVSGQERVYWRVDGKHLRNVVVLL
jgi:hypothetical protein